MVSSSRVKFAYSAHKLAGVREAIEAAQAKVVYLPRYSPGLNLIELVFSKLKWLLCSRKARSRIQREQRLEESLA